MKFLKRIDAGKKLAELLSKSVIDNPVIVGLPRGGVPVAYVVAKELRAPLEIIVVRKLGVPSQPELAFGAIGEGGEIWINQEVIKGYGISNEVMKDVQGKESDEIVRRCAYLRGKSVPLNFRDRDVVIVDDGIATGATIRVACQVARSRGASRVRIASPVAASSVVTELMKIADEVIVVQVPEDFSAVGQWYEDFTPTTDEEVRELMEKSFAFNRH